MFIRVYRGIGNINYGKLDSIWSITADYDKTLNLEKFDSNDPEATEPQC